MQNEFQIINSTRKGESVHHIRIFIVYGYSMFEEHFSVINRFDCNWYFNFDK